MDPENLYALLNLAAAALAGAVASLHCVGCVWLVDRLFAEEPGSISCWVNVQFGSLGLQIMAIERNRNRLAGILLQAWEIEIECVSGGRASCAGGTAIGWPRGSGAGAFHAAQWAGQSRHGLD